MSDASAWVEGLLRERARPVCLETSTDFHIRAVHGDPGNYGLQLSPGSWACNELPVLYGLDCSREEQLEFVNLAGGAIVDLHLRPTADGAWLLLLDATERHAQLQGTQQEHHEVALLRQALERQATQLREALAEAERSNEAKSRFIAGMSHEFRTPLTAIQGYAERWLATQPGSTEAAAVQRACRYLVTLVDNLLEQGRINAAEIVIQPAPVQVAALVADLDEMFGPLADRRNLALRSLVAEGVPAWIRVDETRLRQIAVNLLGNACKFTDEGHVGFALSHTGDQLQLEVYDSGPGIPAADRERIFGAFERMADDAPGAGLGLAISRQLARRMGGDLSLRPESPQGSRFCLRLEAPACAAPQSLHAHEALDIVLVEDDDALAALFSLVLENEGHQVARAEDVATAVERVRELGPDCVITDLNLPGGNGVNLIRTLRQSGFDGRIVMLTGSTAARDRENALAAGADYFVLKPVQLPRLIEVVHAEPA